MGQIPAELFNAIAKKHEQTMRQAELEQIDTNYDDQFVRLGQAALYVAAHALITDVAGRTRSEASFRVLPFRHNLDVAKARLRIVADRADDDSRRHPFVFKAFSLRYVIEDNLTGQTSGVDIGTIRSHASPKTWNENPFFGFKPSFGDRDVVPQHSLAEASLHEAVAIAQVRMDQWAEMYEHIVHENTAVEV